MFSVVFVVFPAFFVCICENSTEMERQTNTPRPANILDYLEGLLCIGENIYPIKDGIESMVILVRRLTRLLIAIALLSVFQLLLLSLLLLWTK